MLFEILGFDGRYFVIEVLHEFIAEGADLPDKFITIILLFSVLYRCDIFFKVMELR